MAKLIKILAASVGGGIVLGAGIRLGEAIATWEPGAQPGQKFSERLGELEHRLQDLEAEISPADAIPLDFDAGTILSRPATSFETAPGLRRELEEWLAESVATRMADVEARLKAEAERGQKQMLDAFVESVQTRVIHRISQLEDEVAGQSASMNELRECSLRTERSIQKLLGGLDKLIPKPAQDAADAKPDADPPAATPSHKEAPPAASRPRWHLFG